VKAMRQKQRTEDEKVVYLSCPCSERLQEIKAVLQQAGFVVIYALETPPEDAIVIYVHCPLTEREREILQPSLALEASKVLLPNWDFPSTPSTNICDTCLQASMFAQPFNSSPSPFKKALSDGKTNLPPSREAV